MSTEIVEYKAHEAAIADIQRFKGLVVDTSSDRGLAEGKAAQRQVAAVRIALDKSRKKLKEDVLERGRQIDGQAKPLFARVAEIEEPIDAQIEAFTKREQREREAAIKAEQDRILAEQAAAKAAEEKRMAEQRAELARQQAEMDKAQREQREAAAAAARKIEEDQRAARAVIEAEERSARQAREEADRQARLAREAEEAKAKAIRDAEEARLKAERDRIDAEARAIAEAKREAQEEADAKARAEREAEEAKEREIRKAAERINGAEAMLIRFQELYRGLPQFADVSKAISVYLVAHGLEDAQ